MVIATCPLSLIADSNVAHLLQVITVLDALKQEWGPARLHSE